MELISEYLIMIDQDRFAAAYTFCDSPDRFNELVTKYEPNVKITKGHIQQTGATKFPYAVTVDEVPDKAERYFFVRITSGTENIAIGENDKQYADYRSIQRTLLGATKHSGHLVTLRDDVSAYYAHKAYHRIYYIENLMRKLIAFFMFTKVGTKWEQVAMPDTVKNTVANARKRDADDNTDGKSSIPIEYAPTALELTDFITLTEYLFKKYPDKGIDKLPNVLASKAKSLDISLFEPFVHRSNWERYFSSIVQYDGQELKDNWKSLYKLRNIVAHNRRLDRGNYDEIERLVTKLESPLIEAIDNISRVDVPTDERDVVAENMPRVQDWMTIMETFGDISDAWKSLDDAWNTYQRTYFTNKKSAVDLLADQMNDLQRSSDLSTALEAFSRDPGQVIHDSQNSDDQSSEIEDHSPQDG